MEKEKKEKAIKIILLFVILFAILFVVYLAMKYKDQNNTVDNSEIIVDLSKLTYLKGNKSDSLKVYKQSDIETYKEDYTTGNLPDVYITEFLFDGVDMYKPYDLDDFVSAGNEYNVKTEKITNINVNTSSVEFTGSLTGGMISVDTNGLNSDIKILLNNVKLNTNSKKYPAIYVYNKDITYNDHKVVINSLENTTNYVEGGKLKKVSLSPSDDLDIYLDKYKEYTNYYGVYNSDEINNILFAKVEADKEDLEKGDPKYFYKAAGTISSDIDLYFEGKGYLEVNSNTNEGIETKGNLSLSGGTGNYVVTALDDCINTTTNNKIDNARNTITIDVESLVAKVSLDATEGDAIDSNGDLIINGGKIIAVAKSGNDSGIDSETGTYINGGTILATGDMLDNINDNSKQNIIILSFKNKMTKNSLLVFKDTNESYLFGYKTDREYSNLVYSSPTLTNNDYYLYMSGDIKGKESNGLYTNITSYKNGIQLGYTNNGNQKGNDMIPKNRTGSLNEPPKPYNEEAYTTNKTFTIDEVLNSFNGVGTYGEL